MAQTTKKKIGFFLAGIILLGLLGWGIPGIAKGKNTPEVSLRDTSKYANPGALISDEELYKKIETGRAPVIFDIRPKGAYKKGHIQGAVQLWRPDYSAPKKDYGYGGMRDSVQDFTALLGKAGADRNSEIVVYSYKHQADSTRFYWQLKLLKHKNVRLLNGGINAWESRGYPLVKDSPRPTPKVYKAPADIDRSILATLDEVKKNINNPKVQILDTRSLDEATGAKKKLGAFRKGRIPGGVWLHYTENLNPDRTFKSRADLIALYKNIGVTGKKPVITYCQSGVRSSNTLFVLKELLGYKHIKNYDGSWIEWSYNKDLPLEKGPLTKTSFKS